MIKKLFKFATSGVISSAVNLGVFFLLEHVAGINYMLSVIASTACSATFHFMLQKKWVFKTSESGKTKTESYLFFIAALINLMLNEVLLVMFVSVFNVMPFIAQFISLGILACMNYFLYEKIIFRKSHSSANRLHDFLDRMGFKHALLIIGFILWAAIHYWGVTYGTQDIPLHQSYVGDEQAPVNGALHILNDKSLLAVHNLKTLYYGPVFATLALPAVAGDFIVQFMNDAVKVPDDYKRSIFWDWGGIIVNARAIAVLASIIGLISVFLLARTRFFNPNKNASLPYLSTLLVGLNFYYFEYSHFFKHWIFITALFLVQLLIIAKISDSADRRSRRKWWIANAVVITLSFGISYTSLFFQLVWFGLLIHWLAKKDFGMLKEWFASMCGALVGILLMFWWHPYALLRIFRGGATIPFGEEMLGFAYFGTLVVVNHAGLFVAIAAMCVHFFGKKVFTRTSIAFISGMACVGIFQYVLFSAQPGLNREGRYMLPTIACLLLVCAHMWGLYFSQHNRKRVLDAIIISSCAFVLVFHVAHIVKWIQVYAQGPVEQQMLARVRQDVREGESVLLVQYYIAGAPHSKDAYRNYMDRFNRSNVNLFKELLDAKLPEGIVPLNAYYVRPDKFVKEDVYAFDHAWLLIEPRHEINQFDYFDESLVRLWWHKELSPQYYEIK